MKTPLAIIASKERLNVSSDLSEFMLSVTRSFGQMLKEFSVKGKQTYGASTFRFLP